MSKLTAQDVKNIAQLARLRLTDEETAIFQTQLSEVLEYAARLETLDVDGILPTTSALPLHTVMRPDQATEGLPRDDALTNAPDATDGSFQVKSIF